MMTTNMMMSTTEQQTEEDDHDNYEEEDDNDVIYDNPRHSLPNHAHHDLDNMNKCSLQTKQYPPSQE